jgi:hypothetical protein
VGDAVPGGSGGKLRVGRLGPGYRSFRICPNLSLRDSHGARRMLDELASEQEAERAHLSARASKADTLVPHVPEPGWPRLY